MIVANTPNVLTDGHKSNASSSIRTRYTAIVKSKIITMHKIEFEKLSILQFVKKHNLPDKFK